MSLKPPTAAQLRVLRFLWASDTARLHVCSWEHMRWMRAVLVDMEAKDEWGQVCPVRIEVNPILARSLLNSGWLDLLGRSETGWEQTNGERTDTEWSSWYVIGSLGRIALVFGERNPEKRLTTG
jgi:hypothetical protein